LRRRPKPTNGWRTDDKTVQQHNSQTDKLKLDKWYSATVMR
jgi:hypothetical protein